MTEEEFITELTKLNIEVTPEKLEQLKEYASFLLEYNQHTNLTAIRDINEVYLKHFYDSLTIVKAINLKEVNTLLDIGTGPGFPGMVLKIIYPHLQITLMDSNNKKINFLKALAQELNLNVEIIYGRAEEFIVNRREYYDVVTSRAVASLDILAELSIPYVKTNGLFVAMKSNYQEELQATLPILKKLDSKVEKIEKFSLPKIEANRAIICIRKEKATNHKYPRNYNQIKNASKLSCKK